MEGGERKGARVEGNRCEEVGVGVLVDRHVLRRVEIPKDVDVGERERKKRIALQSRFDHSQEVGPNLGGKRMCQIMKHGMG